MKSDLVFKIGTLCSFFLIGLEYISKNIASGTLLNYFVGVIIIIISLSVIYFFIILIKYKEISFKIKQSSIRFINNSQYHIYIKNIIYFSKNKEEFYIFSVKSDEKDAYIIRCLAGQSTLSLLKIPKDKKITQVWINYFITNEIYQNHTNSDLEEIKGLDNMVDILNTLSKNKELYTIKKVYFFDKNLV